MNMFGILICRDQSEYRGNELLEDIRGLKEKYGLKEE
jgi:hypothetical protein